MRNEVLSAATAGMTRLRSKGGAAKEALYELTNGYVDAARAIKQRPAFAYNSGLPTASKGLCSFGGALYTFVAAPVTPVAGVTAMVLIHPTPGFSGSLSKIHFAQPFMNYLYVVAEFSDTLVVHYWLQTPPAWKANHIYKANELVEPTTPNGLYYRAIQSTTSAPAWTPLLQHAMGDLVQPTEYNGFQYEVIAENGTIFPITPAYSGATEPVWPTTNGATILEVSTGTVTTTPAPPPTPPPATPPGRQDGGRYDNPGGSASRREDPFLRP